jgi:hypothetical protein
MKSARTSRQGPDPVEGPLAPLLPGFDPVSDDFWDETAVRKVLHTFAYGGQASDGQIRLWASMPPRAAIVQMLTFAEHNPLLSPAGPRDYDRLDTRPGTLRAVGDFWASDDPANGVVPASRSVYDVDEFGAGVPSLVWLQAATSRGLNPFRQRIGLWETNYHLAVNRTMVRTNQLIRYYDDIMSGLARGEPYHEILATAATSAAIASQYGHRLSQYVNGECKKCNEDFAREYYQLFFGILGETDPTYHELTTIKNMSKALTDMSNVVNGQLVDYLVFGTAAHFPGQLEMLQVTFGGSQAQERISELSRYAIENTESLNNLPVMIIAGLADDNLNEDKIARIRTAWTSMPQKYLLDFLQAYAVSTLFHDPSRIKYRSSIDRNLLVLNQMTLVNEENYLGVYNPKMYESEDVEVFRPRHNVFGGQTGREAAESADVFLANYNALTDMSQRFRLVSTVKSGRTWEKDWAAVVPLNANGAYAVRDVAEWLWNRFVGDGLKHFGPLERAHVYALLSTELDFAYLADPQNSGRIITTADVGMSPLAELVSDLANRPLSLNSADSAQRQVANRRVGQAVNFIVGTPFVYAEEGR